MIYELLRSDEEGLLDTGFGGMNSASVLCSV